jgi:general secretion pathway protein D
VIIGGLRRRQTEDSLDAIPFIGEIPGIGKFFSTTDLRDGSTEMFIFITPKIVVDPACDLEWIRAEEMLRRPGDIPEFMCGLVEAETCEKNRLLDGWMTTLFGPDPGRCRSPGWHNDDTCSQAMGDYDGR